MEQYLSQITHSLIYILPEIGLLVLFFLLLLIDLFWKKSSLLFYVLLFGLVIEIALIYFTPLQTNLFLNVISADAFAKVFKYIFSITSILVLLILKQSKRDIKIVEQSGETFGILALIILGMNLLAMSQHLLLMFLSLEIVSIGSYVLTVLSFERKSVEISMKYVLFGIFSSAIMLYGMSLLYGLSGSLQLATIAQLAQANHLTFPLMLAFGLSIAGFLFKISASPFHIWTPDVYEGAPTSIVAFFSTVSKAAGLAVICRFAMSLSGLEIYNLLVVIVLASIAIGNFSALWQQSFKRLMAYSGIAQAGFILIGLLTFSDTGMQVLVFYLIIYIIANLLAFLSIIIIENHFQSDKLEIFSGLGQKSIVFGVCFSISMLTLVGLPPTAGFTAKLLIFTQLWQGKGTMLALITLIIGLLTTAISLYFYLKIPYNLFFKNILTQENHFQLNLSQKVLLTFFTIFLLWFFFQPHLLIEMLKFNFGI